MTEWVYVQRKSYAYLTPYIETVGNCYLTLCKKVWFGKSFTDLLTTNTNGVMTWYASKQDLDTLYTHVSDNVIKNPHVLKSSYARFKPLIKKLIVYSQKMNRKDLSRASDEELWNIYEEYISHYKNATLYGEPLPMVTKDNVLDFIKREINAMGIPKHESNEIITTMSTPTQKSFIRKEEEDLLRIGVSIQNNIRLLNLFVMHTTPQLLTKLKKEKVYSKLLLHEKRYCWVPYDYGVQLWGMKHFVSSLKKMVTRKDCRKEIALMKRDLTLLKKNQKQITQRYRFSRKIKELFEYVRLATYLMDFKKEEFTKSHYLAIPLVKELARRFHTDSVYVRYLNHAEVRKGLLLGKKVTPSLLKQRWTLSTMLWHSDGSTEYIPREKVRAYIKKHLKENTDELKGTKLHGICASLGRYTGIAKVVKSAMHVTKVNRGDVLIAPMTSPDYVVGMKNAGAIVTDEGGITCHAAIVARELKIPCVVGTGNATRIFKDGDIVEVNAVHASVRLIERAK